jgi:transposase
MTRFYGRAPRGARVQDFVPNGRWETTTMMAIIGAAGPQAPWVLDGPMDGAAFLTYVGQVLVPILRPTDILVMDNLSSHKNPAARALILETGAQIWDLPAYSPDFNPIEMMWSKVKAFLRKTKARDSQTLFQAIGQALAQVSLDDIKGWFVECGYSLS